MKKKEKKILNENRMLKKRVIGECAWAMRFPVFFEALVTVITAIFGVLISDTLGQFADAAFELNLDMGIENAAILGGCLLLVVVVVPLVGMFSDFLMLKEALSHDNIVFGHFLNKRIEKERLLNSGEIQFELEDAPNTLRIQWVRIVSKAIAFPFCLGYFLYFVGRISWLMTCLMFLIAVVKLVLPICFKERLAKYDRSEKKYQAKRRDYETDILTRPYIAKMWKLQKGVTEFIEELFKKYYYQTASRKATWEVLSEQGQDLVNKIVMILILLVGALLVSWGSISPGEFAALFVYQNVLQTLFQYLGEIIQNFPLLKNALDRVCEIYQDEESLTGVTITDFKTLTGEKVCFCYEGKKILEELNFQIKKAEKIQIYGPNGRGKSTVMNLLCTILESYTGKISVNGFELHDINKKDWRKLIAYAPQTPYLFRESVIENIMMGNWNAEKEKIEQLMKDFGILHLAERMVDMDSDLSGGEKQKISLIRAMIKDAQIILLDEPSNHLDQKSIAVLKNYIEETSQTVIFITHDKNLTDVKSRSIEI